jgi:hypothetical protein
MARQTYIINSTSIVSVVEALVNDVVELQNAVERLADGQELLAVAGKKNLGKDADTVLRGVDDFRARDRANYSPETLSSYSNELGENFAEQPYHPEPVVLEEPVSEVVATTENPRVDEDSTGHFVKAS